MADVALKPADRESLERYARIAERLARELDELLSAHEALQKRRKKIVASGKKPTWYLDRRDAWNAEALTWRRKKVATLRTVAEQHVTAFTGMLKIWSGMMGTPQHKIFDTEMRRIDEPYNRSLDKLKRRTLNNIDS